MEGLEAQDETVEALSEATNRSLPSAIGGSKNPFFAGKILSILVTSALQVFPGDLDLIMEFWSLYRQFPDTEHLQEDLYDTLRAFDPLPSRARGFLSRVPLLNCTAVEATEEFLGPYRTCITQFRAHVKEAPESSMYSEYTSFFFQLLSRCSDSSCVSPSHPFQSTAKMNW
jgi:hypothetical protein